MTSPSSSSSSTSSTGWTTAGLDAAGVGITTAADDGSAATAVTLITGLSITALAELMDATSEETDTAGFLSGFSGTVVVDNVTAVLETSIAVLADDSAEEGLDVADETAAEPERDGTPGLAVAGRAAAG